MKSFEDLLNEPYKRWYRFGWEGPGVAWKRFRSHHRPIRRAQTMWQRARRGWSEEDVWSLDSYLNDVLIGAVSRLRDTTNSYPATGITFQDWQRILDEIVQGITAAKNLETFESFKDEKYDEAMAAFNLAMDHLKNYWFDLWD